MHATSLSHTVYQISIADWHDLRTNEHISRLEYIIRYKILCQCSVLFIVESLYNTVFVYNVPFLLAVLWYDRGERRLFNPPSACLRFNYLKNKCDISSIIIYTILVSLPPKIVRVLYVIGVYTERNPKEHSIMSFMHTIAIAIVIWLYFCQRHKPHTWTTLQHMVEANVDRISWTKYQSRIHLLLFLRCGEICLQETAISRCDLGNSEPGSLTRSERQGHI